MRIETIGNAVLYLGDCVEILPSLPAVRAIVTSPPYGAIRDYGGHAAVNCYAVISHCAEALLPGGVLMWNVNDQVINGSESGESFRHALYAMSIGLRLHDTMIYCKNGVTFPGVSRYHASTEYMFVLSKCAPARFNGVRDKVNAYAGTRFAKTDRQKDGTTRAANTKDKTIPAYGLRQNWWVMNNGQAGNGEFEGHPAPMPPAMAYGHVETWTDPGETVLDPFMGSGTTGVACMNLSRKFTGIEIHEPYFNIACRRIEQAQKQQRLFA